DREAHPWLHLMDGGLADNLGLRAIYDLYVRSDIRRKINNGEIKRLLVIVVNAKTEKRENWDRRESPPGLKTVGFKTATVSMDNYSFETVEMFREAAGERIKAQEYLSACQKYLDEHSTDGYKLPIIAGGNLKLYVADLCFNNLADEQEKEYFNNLPTSFNLTETEVDRLIEVGGRLLIEHPEYKKFMDENQ
ncbi:patatin-like phospholipase family protein, partial [candidate division KSB1 bacterium]|nr:patatin-like phospholipase family protein [candidate division KSB1 bacterium]